MASTSRPRSSCTPPFQSVTATIRAPMRRSSLADTAPTLPNPWTATRAPSRPNPTWRAASRATMLTPRPVASRRPADPPSSSGLPVTTAVVVAPACML